VYAGKLNSEYSETENVVFSNCAIMVPLIYPKNPSVAFTPTNAKQEGFAKALQTLVNKLFTVKEAPGLNLKTKMRRTVLTTQLTNRAYVKLEWVFKKDSDETAIAQLAALAQELATAKDVRTIKEVEGKIMALEAKIALLSPAGPKLTTRLPHHIVTDPTGLEPDLTDSNWVMEWDYLPTNYINAVYGTKENDQYRSVYEPTHILMGGRTTDTGIEDEINSFTLIKGKEEHRPGAYGYQSSHQLNDASYTKVWWVWDRTTRRVYLFADNNWKWPIWVWDDPYGLPRFFPYFPLWFHESVNSVTSSGEVSYYLDQQDAINEINDEARRGRHWVRRNVFFDKKSISQDDVTQVLKGPDGTARGVNLPEGKSLNDVIFSLVPPALKFPELFNTEGKFAAINRISGINDALRGGQFKTNTTNQAIEQYQENTDTRVEDRVDMIEDFVALIGWNIAAMCAKFWTREDVVPWIGDEQANNWVQIPDMKVFQSMYNPQVEGGSMAKPNSRQKQQQALQMGQVLGQFANAAPAVVLVLLKAIERSFDEVVITDDEWQMLLQSVQASLVQQQAPPTQQQGGRPDPEQLKAEIQQQIAQLSPEQKARLEQLIQQGAPPADALREVQQAAQQQQ
jgi:hypothetical protein